MKNVLAPILLLALACDGPNGPPPARTGADKVQHDTTLEHANRVAAQREVRDVDDWIERQGVTMEATGTGVHVKLVRDVPGATARPGQHAVVRYAVMLLNGDTAYSSAAGATESFLIEEDDVESGLHEGIQYLSPGDSAVIVIPSHRAHGLLGDRDRIPPRSTVVYAIGLVKLR